MPFGNSGAACPEGAYENSPAFQRRGSRRTLSSPEGTTELPRPFASIQPSRRDLNALDDVPGVETPGYCRMSLRDNASPTFAAESVRKRKSLKKRSSIKKVCTKPALLANPSQSIRHLPPNYGSELHDGQFARVGNRNSRAWVCTKPILEKNLQNSPQ